MKIELLPIAWIKNKRLTNTDDFWGNTISEIILAPEISAEAIDGIDDFSHLEIIFYFHECNPAKINYKSRHPRNNPDWPKVGIFAQRGKNRPNHLGLSIVKLIEKKERALIVSGLDAIDGTPVLDIKPVMTGFLPQESIREPSWPNELMRNYWKTK